MSHSVSAQVSLLARRALGRGAWLLTLALGLSTAAGCGSTLANAQAKDAHQSECRVHAAEDGDGCELRSADKRTTIKVSMSGDVGEALYAAAAAEVKSSQGGSTESASSESDASSDEAEESGDEE